MPGLLVHGRLAGPALAAGVLLAGCMDGGSGGNDGAAAAGTPEPVAARAVLADGCFALRSVAARGFVAADGDDGYAASARSAVAALPFHLKPTGPGTYLLFDRDRRLLAVDDPLGGLADGVGAALEEAGGQAVGSAGTVSYVEALRPVAEGAAGVGESVTDTGDAVAAINGPAEAGRADAAGPLTEWAVAAEGRRFTLRAIANDRLLVADPDDGTLSLAESGAAGDAAAFAFLPAAECARFPEAEVGARGEPFAGTNPDGTVFGFADTHVHLMATDRLGGRVIYGEPFHRFGVEHALHDCAEDHGPQGSADVIGNFQRDGAPVGSHATRGWPTFEDWPVHDTLSHQQTYYVWLERAWMAGLRLVVNHLSADEALCQATPLKDHGCDEMDGVRMQIERMHALEDYVDAQAGGPGRGWLRIVTDPGQARRVIEDGKLAVVLGIESSKLFGCGEFLDDPECTRADIDAAIDEFHALGVRSVFPAHWFDNALAGPGLFGPTELVLNLFNKLETGHYYRVQECPEPGMGANQQSVGQPIPGDDPLIDLINGAQAFVLPTYPPGPHCNALGLTDLGEYLIERLIDKGMLIETDHMSAAAKNRVLDIAKAHDHPVISGHFGTGGVTTPSQLERIFGVGGLASPFNAPAPALAEAILAMAEFRRDDYFFGVGFASDAGGLAAQPAPRADADEQPLEYPFRSYDGGVEFVRQRTGDRVYDLNADGVAHYGLYADLIADMREQPGGERALEYLFRSAEAYLRMWERANAP